MGTIIICFLLIQEFVLGITAAAGVAIYTIADKDIEDSEMKRYGIVIPVVAIAIFSITIHMLWMHLSMFL